MDCIFLLCFACITTTVRDDFTVDQIQFSGQSIFTCLPCEVFNFIENMESPNPIPQWLQHFHVRRARLSLALFFIQESIPGFDCIHSIRIEGPQQDIILNGPTERDIFYGGRLKSKESSVNCILIPHFINRINQILSNFVPYVLSFFFISFILSELMLYKRRRV